MTWVTRWKYEMADKPSRPGVWRLKAGGFFVRARVKDPNSTRRKEVTAVLRHEKDPRAAERELERLVAEARAELTGEILESPPWSGFAVSLLEERMRKGKIESAATVDRWKEALGIFIPAFGHIPAADLKRARIDRWINTVLAEWMTTGKPSTRKRRIKGELVEQHVLTRIKPTTANGWLRVLKAICNAARVKFELAKSPFDGIEFFEEGRVYTKEEPNSLPPEVVSRFLAIAKAKFPQHYAMMMLGFATGLRPSSLRPLRRRGPESDIDWATGVLLVRRSHSRRQRIMNATKTKKDTVIALPSELLEVLRLHVAALKGKQAESDLLFPSDRGTFRTRTVLAKPFEAINAELALPYRVTPRAMRRSFQDIARMSAINDFVTRSISGHATEQMQHHYSTAQASEQREALARIHATIASAKGGNEGEKR